MDVFDYWRLCDQLSVVQAALLIVGEDPSTFDDGGLHNDQSATMPQWLPGSTLLGESDFQPIFLKPKNTLAIP